MFARPLFAYPLRLSLLLVSLALCLFPLQSSHAQTVDSIPADAPVATVSVMVELTQPAAAEVYAAQAVSAASADALAAVTQAHIAGLITAQDALISTLSAYDAQVLFQVQRVYNGVAVRLPADQVDAVAALPGVRAVHPLIAKTPANDRRGRGHRRAGCMAGRRDRAVG